MSLIQKLRRRNISTVHLAIVRSVVAGKSGKRLKSEVGGQGTTCFVMNLGEFLYSLCSCVSYKKIKI